MDEENEKNKFEFVVCWVSVWFYIILWRWTRKMNVFLKEIKILLNDIWLAKKKLIICDVLIGKIT